MKPRAERNDIDILIALELWDQAEIYTIPANNELSITIVGGYKVVNNINFRSTTLYIWKVRWMVYAPN